MRRTLTICMISLCLLGLVSGGVILLLRPAPEPLPPPPEQNAAMEFTLPMLTMETAGPLLRNPDRGLRMETYITLTPEGPPESYPGSAQDPYEKLLGFAEAYEAESPTLVQLYVYLCRFNDRALNEHALAQLQQMLELCRSQGLRVLLRLAYQNESNPDADWPRVEGHLSQLGTWFEANAQLLEDTLCVVQAGIVGYWGEGHGYVNFKKKYIGQAIDQLLRITPEDVFVQVRETRLYNAVSEEYHDRLGMHDDYLIGEAEGKWNFFFGKQNNDTALLEARFRRTLNDGELPWGRATYYDKPNGHPLDSLEALPILLQLKQYSLTSLSLEHNYREAGPEKVYSMARWREQSLTAAQLEQAGLPYHPALLEGGSISVFEYIQYHLGYLLSITSYEYSEGQIRFTLQNNGFAAPLNFNHLSLVVDGEEYPVEGYDKYALGSMQAVTYTLDLPPGTQPEQLGLKLARRAGSDICARFMNDTAFIEGVQELFI